MNVKILKRRKKSMTSGQADEFIKLVHSSNGADVLFAKICFEAYETLFDEDDYLSVCRTELSHALQRLEQYYYRYQQLPE